VANTAISLPTNKAAKVLIDPLTRRALTFFIYHFFARLKSLLGKR